jgi:hypothetical protein
MRKILNITLSTLALAAISSSALANGLERTAVTAAGTYTKPSGHDLNFVNEALGTNYSRPLVINPEFHWDYNFGMTHRLADSNTRLVLNYDHFNNDNRRTFNTTEGYVKHKDRDFKVGVNHTLEFGPKFDLVLGGAFEYAKIQRNFNIDTGVNNTKTFNEAKGWGPYVSLLARGFPMSKSCGMSLYGNAGIGVLYAQNKFNQQVRNAAGALQAGSFDPQNTKGALAKVDAGFGVEYQRTMRSDMANLLLGVRLGVKYNNYLNGLRNNVDSNDAYASNQRDYGRIGPFLEFKLGGADA